MGNCIYCGEKAGIFRSSHKECKRRHELNQDSVRNLGRQFLTEQMDIEQFESGLNKLIAGDKNEVETKRGLVVHGFEAAVASAFEDNLLSKEEEGRLHAYLRHFGLKQDDVDGNGAFSQCGKGSILRDVLEGRYPELKLQIDGSLPFNLQKQEKLLWVFQSVDYLKLKTFRKYVGGSRGVSVKIAKGVYWRAGAFRGQSVPYNEIVTEGTGLMGVTQKHIYFSSPEKSTRIPYSKIIAFEPLSDGIGIHRDGANSKPEFFKTGDGWFTYNLCANASELE